MSFIEREHNELQKEFDMLKLIMNPGQMEKIMVKLESEVASSCLDDSDDVELILPVSDGEDSCGGDAKRICLVSDETIEPNINGDMEVLFSRAPATADFPHARSECYRNRFDKVAADDNTNAMFCSKCFCFICDRLASEVNCIIMGACGCVHTCTRVYFGVEWVCCYFELDYVLVSATPLPPPLPQHSSSSL